MVEKRETAKFWRDTAVPGLELLRATYITHAFAPHIHEGYALGVIDAGAETFTYRRGTHIAAAGSIVVINPGELHTGEAVTEQGWSYRMLYPDAALVRQAATEVMGRTTDFPFFPEPVFFDPELADALRHLHVSLEQAASPLERETRFLWTLAQLVSRHADSRPMAPRLKREREVAQRVRIYLDAHLAENITLDHLAQSVGFSRFHLLRVFRAEVGLPPHAYLTQARVWRAKALLAAGRPIAEVAIDVGFVDQSHLTRHFKRIVGVPPGQYR